MENITDRINIFLNEIKTYSKNEIEKIKVRLKSNNMADVRNIKTEADVKNLLLSLDKKWNIEDDSYMGGTIYKFNKKSIAIWFDEEKRLTIYP
jgi:hypothetical protein